VLKHGGYHWEGVGREDVGRDVSIAGACTNGTESSINSSVCSYERNMVGYKDVDVEAAHLSFAFSALVDLAPPQPLTAEHQGRMRRELL
jgi:hypothetical protein